MTEKAASEKGAMHVIHLDAQHHLWLGIRDGGEDGGMEWQRRTSTFCKTGALQILRDRNDGDWACDGGTTSEGGDNRA